MMWREASGRLTVDLDVPYTEYAALCKQIADAFELSPDRDFAVGLDQICWTFRRGDAVIGFDWDVWMGFMVSAHTPGAEPLVEEIAVWLRARSSN